MPTIKGSLIRLLLTALLALTLACPAWALSSSHLRKRERKQVASLRAELSHLRFFRRHPRLAHTSVGRREVRRARIWVRVIRRELAETRAALRPRPIRPTSVPAIICKIFGPECGKALAVSRCESGFSTYARNGQYLGIFQMGSAERARFGDGQDAWSQAQAAHRYFLVAGWGPWECA